jgi:ribosomal-protein-alanine N-acetyltransferase
MVVTAKTVSWAEVTLPVIRTAHLVLVPFAPDDLESLYALWTDPHVRRYLWDDIVISRERAADTLDAALAAFTTEGLGHWTTRQSLDGPVIGECGFRLVEGTSQVELMCSLLPARWGQGLALEGCRAAIEYLWNTSSLPEIVARADIPNNNSIRLMERLGMHYGSNDGVLVKYVLARP